MKKTDKKPDGFSRYISKDGKPKVRFDINGMSVTLSADYTKECDDCRRVQPIELRQPSPGQVTDQPFCGKCRGPEATARRKAKALKESKGGGGEPGDAALSAVNLLLHPDGRYELQRPRKKRPSKKRT